MESNRIARKPMDRGASSIRQEKQSKTVLQELCNCSLEGDNEKGEEQEQDGSKRGDLRVTDVDMDSLVLCASNLDLHDLVNMAMTCHRFRDAAYSDTVWEIQCRKRWPPKQMCDGGTFQYSGGRDAYVARHTFSQQLRYTDPTDAHLHLLPMPINHLLLDNDTVTIAQGPIITVWKVGPTAEGHMEAPSVTHALRDHNARITCMRLVPVAALGAMRNFLGGASNFLITSSCDHTIRIWGKGRSLRTLRGHQGPVQILADKLVGKEGSLPVLASGGSDCTVRLWGLTSSGGNRGHSPLLATLHGHEQPIKELAVARHNPNLLVSAAKDTKIRVWDVAATSSGAAGACVGSTRGFFEGVPVGLKTGDSLCYIGSGSSVKAVDLRTLRTVATAAFHEPGILTFALSPSGVGICTGGLDRTAKLWDLRKSEECPEPWAVLGNHMGPVHCVHYDMYKVISGGPSDREVHVWNAETGDEISTLDCAVAASSSVNVGVSALVANGGKLVTGTCGEDPGVVRLQDFSNCVNPLVECDTEVSNKHSSTSKFWESVFNTML